MIHKKFKNKKSLNQAFRTKSKSDELRVMWSAFENDSLLNIEIVFRFSLKHKFISNKLLSKSEKGISQDFSKKENLFEGIHW